MSHCFVSSSFVVAMMHSFSVSMRAPAVGTKRTVAAAECRSRSSTICLMRSNRRNKIRLCATRRGAQSAAHPRRLGQSGLLVFHSVDLLLGCRLAYAYLTHIGLLKFALPGLALCDMGHGLKPHRATMTGGPMRCCVRRWNEDVCSRLHTSLPSSSHCGLTCRNCARH